MRLASRLPAAVLVVVLAILPVQAWLRVGRADVRSTRPLDALPSITWAGTLAADGRLAVAITYTFGDDREHAIEVRLPAHSRFLAVDGVPLAADSGRFAEASGTGSITVTYERLGVVTRYDDGVVVRLLPSPDLSDADAAFPCPGCSSDIEGYGDSIVYGALFAGDLDGARLALTAVSQLHTGVDDGALRFVGVLAGADGMGLVAWLPPGAAPDAPAPDGDDPAFGLDAPLAADPIAPAAGTAASAASAAEAWQQAHEEADESPFAGDRLREARSSPPIGRFVTALLLSSLWIALVAFVALRIAAARRALAADAPDLPGGAGGPGAPGAGPAGTAAFSPPSDLEPGLVGTVVGETGRGSRSPIAATLLALAHRGVIRIDGVDSQRFTLTVPPGARGATPLEEAVLAELRPQGQVSSTATLTGPPLWGQTGRMVEQRIQRVVAREARRARLVRTTLAAGVLVPAALAMGLVAVIGSGGGSVLAWVVLVLGPLVAVAAALLTGTNLTARGRHEREQWLRYQSWLRANSELHRVGAPGIAAWGEPLVYAAALGAAPAAADALAP